MRLINCKTMQLEEYFGSKIPGYAILSHTWGDDEVSFADFTQDEARASSKQGCAKIVFTCKQALQDGLYYAWVDTCCIDKSSSAELSEAVNSMFAWYKNSKVCYVYLQDVLGTQSQVDFEESRWFTRGWTLQELLAPWIVQFYDRKWNHLGRRENHAELITEITGIDGTALKGHPGNLDQFCVARKMSWASKRKTTGTEDMAYCLLGIFGISMPLIYGEGGRAFARLQEEIIRSRDDDSIFAWGLNTTMHHRLGLLPDLLVELLQSCKFDVFSYLLADSPAEFENCTRLIYPTTSPSSWTMTSAGLQIQLPLVRIQSSPTFSYDREVEDQFYLGLLGCSQGSDSECLGIVLRLVDENDDFSKRLERVHFWDVGYRCNTILVGPRAIAQSVMEHVTIVRDRIPYWRPTTYTSHFHVIMHVSYPLAIMGYNVTDGITVLPSEITWDSDAMQLTVPRTYEHLGWLRFTFESRMNSESSSFFVYMNMPLRQAVVLPRDTTLSNNLLPDLSLTIPRDLPSEKVAVDSGKNVIQIKTDITEKRVYDWHIYELNVDFRPRSLPLSLPENHWYWNWKRKYHGSGN